MFSRLVSAIQGTLTPVFGLLVKLQHRNKPLLTCFAAKQLFRQAFSILAAHYLPITTPTSSRQPLNVEINGDSHAIMKTQISSLVSV